MRTTVEGKRLELDFEDSSLVTHNVFVFRPKSEQDLSLNDLSTISYADLLELSKTRNYIIKTEYIRGIKNRSNVSVKTNSVDYVLCAVYYGRLDNENINNSKLYYYLTYNEDLDSSKINLLDFKMGTGKYTPGGVLDSIKVNLEGKEYVFYKTGQYTSSNYLNQKESDTFKCLFELAYSSNYVNAFKVIKHNHNELQQLYTIQLKNTLTTEIPVTGFILKSKYYSYKYALAAAEPYYLQPGKILSLTICISVADLHRRLVNSHYNQYVADRTGNKLLRTEVLTENGRWETSYSRNYIAPYRNVYLHKDEKTILYSYGVPDPFHINRLNLSFSVVYQNGVRGCLFSNIPNGVISLRFTGLTGTFHEQDVTQTGDNVFFPLPKSIAYLSRIAVQGKYTSGERSTWSQTRVDFRSVRDKQTNEEIDISTLNTETVYELDRMSNQYYDATFNLEELEYNSKLNTTTIKGFLPYGCNRFKLLNTETNEYVTDIRTINGGYIDTVIESDLYNHINYNIICLNNDTEFDEKCRHVFKGFKLSKPYPLQNVQYTESTRQISFMTPINTTRVTMSRWGVEIFSVETVPGETEVVTVALPLALNGKYTLTPINTEGVKGDEYYLFGDVDDPLPTKPSDALYNFESPPERVYRGSVPVYPKFETVIAGKIRITFNGEPIKELKRDHTNSGDVERIWYQGDKFLVTISRFGMTFHDANRSRGSTVYLQFTHDWESENQTDKEVFVRYNGGYVPIVGNGPGYLTASESKEGYYRTSALIQMINSNFHVSTIPFETLDFLQKTNNKYIKLAFSDIKGSTNTSSSVVPVTDNSSTKFYINNKEIVPEFIKDTDDKVTGIRLRYSDTESFYWEYNKPEKGFAFEQLDESLIGNEEHVDTKYTLRIKVNVPRGHVYNQYTIDFYTGARSTDLLDYKKNYIKYYQSDWLYTSVDAIMNIYPYVGESSYYDRFSGKMSDNVYGYLVSHPYMMVDTSSFLIKAESPPTIEQFNNIEVVAKKFEQDTYNLSRIIPLQVEELPEVILPYTPVSANENSISYFNKTDGEFKYKPVKLYSSTENFYLSNEEHPYVFKIHSEATGNINYQVRFYSIYQSKQLPFTINEASNPSVTNSPEWMQSGYWNSSGVIVKPGSTNHYKKSFSDAVEIENSTHYKIINPSLITLYKALVTQKDDLNRLTTISIGNRNCTVVYTDTDRTIKLIDSTDQDRYITIHETGETIYTGFGNSKQTLIIDLSGREEFAQTNNVFNESALAEEKYLLKIEEGYSYPPFYSIYNKAKLKNLVSNNHVNAFINSNNYIIVCMFDTVTTASDVINVDKNFAVETSVNINKGANYIFNEISKYLPKLDIDLFSNINSSNYTDFIEVFSNKDVSTVDGENENLTIYFGEQSDNIFYKPFKPEESTVKGVINIVVKSSNIVSSNTGFVIPIQETKTHLPIGMHISYRQTMTNAIPEIINKTVFGNNMKYSITSFSFGPELIKPVIKDPSVTYPLNWAHSLEANMIDV